MESINEIVSAMTNILKEVFLARMAVPMKNETWHIPLFIVVFLR